MNFAGRFIRIEDSRRPLIRRGSLCVSLDPVTVWLDRSLVPLSPLEGALMLVLVRKGRATWADIDAAISGDNPRPELRSVLIHRIRRKFEAAGGTDPIETIRGWGLRLCVPPDERRSTSLWIGERETFLY